MTLATDPTVSDHVGAALTDSTTEIHNAPRQLSWKSSSWEERGVWSLFAIIAIILAVPLASLYYYLLGVSYFQHYPLLLVAGAVLAYQRVKQYGFEYVGNLSTRTILWLTLTLLITASVFFLPSRWMAAPAAVCWLISLITYLGGPTLRGAMTAPMWFALALIPPPSNIANAFMIQLQNLATRIASYWLDFFDIYHYTTGVSILTPNSSYLVKDACSGIQSVFAAIAIGVFYGVMRGYNVARFILLIAQLIFWVLVANSLRVFLIMYMKEKYQVDLIEGFLHDMVGAATFMLGLTLAISLDHLWRFFVPINKPDDTPEEAEAEQEPEASDAQEGELEPENEGLFVTIRRFAWLEYVPDPLISYSILGVMSVACVLSAITLYKFEVPQFKQVVIKDLVDKCCLDFNQIDENFLPPQLNGWRRMGYEKEERTEDSAFGGMVSFRWQYMHSSGRLIVLSIDGPYDNWHDLTACYGGLGWAMDSKDLKPAVGLSRPAVAYDLLMRRGGIDHAQSMYVCWDQTGRNIEPPENYGDGLTTVVSRLSKLLDEPKPIVGGAIQLQLYSQKAMGLSQKEYDDNRQLFWAATEWITQKFPVANDSEGKP